MPDASVTSIAEQGVASGIHDVIDVLTEHFAHHLEFIDPADDASNDN